jgi:hypothetical protein
MGDFAEPVLAYVIGNVGYLVAFATLMTATVAGFDRAVGRREPREFRTQPFEFDQPNDGSPQSPPIDVVETETLAQDPDDVRSEL